MVTKIPNEKAISMVVILIIMLVIVSILNMTYNISRYTHKKIRIRNDLHKIFQEFCEMEDVEVPKIVESKSFWYRSMSHTIGVKNLESSYLIDAFAFLHELYHSKDRKRLLKIQSFVSIYSYLISVLLKLLALYSMWFEKYISFLKPILMIDVVILLICMILTVFVESYASKGALAFLEKNKYIEKNRIVKFISFLAILSYIFQSIIFVILSMMLFYLVS